MTTPSFLLQAFLSLSLHSILSAKSPAPTASTGIIDMHCHVAGIGAGDSGCFVSEKLRHSLKFRTYLRSFSVTLEEVEKGGDEVIAQKIVEGLKAGGSVQRAVILAMDGVVSPDGQLDRDATEMYVPNEYVASLCKKHPELLYGASINPKRRDAVQRLAEARKAGAVLIKWLPPIQDIDPSDKAFIPFYREMAALGIPLLTHTGNEGAFTKADAALGDPERLRLPLSLGVRVIAAHAGIPGVYNGESGLDRLCRLAREYPGLYVDVSSLTQFNKRSALPMVLERKELEGRLVYGTDYPLMSVPVLCSPWLQMGRLRPRRVVEISRQRNAWDRDLALKQALGLKDSDFHRFEELLPVQPKQKSKAE